MNKTKIYLVIEYLCATLIISYFFVHNIFLVLIGITFSLYLINFNFFNSFIRSINNNFFINKSAIELNKNDKLVKSNSINIEPIKDEKNLTLVETVEELGFIPSIDKNDESKAA